MWYVASITTFSGRGKDFDNVGDFHVAICGGNEEKTLRSGLVYTRNEKLDELVVFTGGIYVFSADCGTFLVVAVLRNEYA